MVSSILLIVWALLIGCLFESAISNFREAARMFRAITDTHRDINSTLRAATDEQ